MLVVFVEIYSTFDERLILGKNLVNNNIDISSLNRGVYLLRMSTLKNKLG